ncbi:MAG: hypothetical protein GYB20_10835 [Oceanospirillales bacterium]|nr:hypothetical protein [Oceanospirillales bacterium]MBR9888172.1 hypothetical protein [Oceanospirillales bacterium]
MSSNQYTTVAESIIQGRKTATAIGSISAEYPQLTIDDAYQIQSIVNQCRLAEGARIIGYKIGLTSEAVQQQLGVDQPDYGVLFSDMEVLSGEPVNCGGLIAPKAEGEIGFCFKENLDRENLTFMELLSAIDYFFPVIEIVDSVVADWKIGIVDTIADNASSALYMPGKRFFSPKGVDFEALEVAIHSNNECVASGRGAACLGSPLLSTFWLAKKLIELNTPIQKGQIVLSGALAPMVNLIPGKQYSFSFEGLDEISLIAE